MNLCGFIKVYQVNLSFALPVFIDTDAKYYIQDSSNEKGIIDDFIELESISKKTLKPVKKQIERKKGESILYIFITHNGKAIAGTKSEIADSLDDCYRQVFFSMFELMDFLGKGNKSERIKEYLFPEYMNKNEKSEHNQIGIKRNIFKRMNIKNRDRTEQVSNCICQNNFWLVSAGEYT